MRTEQFDYDLPKELIAQRPASVRSESRLLVMEGRTGALFDRRFDDIVEYLRPGDCLVLNDTKVLPARFFGLRVTGARLEGLFLSEDETGLWEVMLKNARKVKAGETIVLCDKAQRPWCRAKLIEDKGGGRWVLKVEVGQTVEKILERIGFAPLPPYIKRSGEDNDLARTDIQRYQTIYAEKPGAVAAPTAGLHFTEKLVAELKDKGVRAAYLTLHVGLGTFKPVTSETLDEHEMHSEWFNIPEKAAQTINQCKDNGGRIVAVGTTSVRTLETIGTGRKVKACHGNTKLFIQPGYEFKMVDCLVTNFHLPKSTLLALVAALAGLEEILAAYHHAIEQRYRFYSYGDAMLII